MLQLYVIECFSTILIEPETKVQALRAALIEGENSGPPEPFNGEDFLTEIRMKHGAQ